MMLQRLATGANGVKQARYRRRPTRGTRTRMRSIYTTCIAAVGIPPRVLHFSALVFQQSKRVSPSRNLILHLGLGSMVYPPHHLPPPLPPSPSL